MSDRGALLLSFYGDDFTGSTDAMEGLTRAGLRTVLFLEPPRLKQYKRYEGVRAVGLAGLSRSMSLAEMDAELTPAFTALRGLNTPAVHYKVCSTFDSSPKIGSIGHAIDIGHKVFNSPLVPLMVGAPILGRYCVFGNLFARSGLDTEPYRLDRHPTMRQHPITPMDEADIRLHLGKQTDKNIELFDILTLSAPADEADRRFAELLESSPGVVLFDVLTDDQLPAIGRLIWSRADSRSPLFVVGSSGVEYALTAHWRAAGQLPEPREFTGAGTVEQVVVVSGSCSPVTGRQIGWALEQGFKEVGLQAVRLIDPGQADAEIKAVISRTLDLLAGGHSVIVHTARGPADPRIAAAAEGLEVAGDDDLRLKLSSGKVFGEALGEVLGRVLEQKPLRAAVVGGDTCGNVARYLGVEALEMIGPLAPGSPLCHVHAPGKSIDGLEITFKGGQVGKTDFFRSLVCGKP